MTNPLHILEDVIARAKRAGADAADGVAGESTRLYVRVRMGATETVERDEAGTLGLRVLIGKPGGYQQAIVSTNDLSEKSLNEMITRAVAMAKLSPADPYADLAPKALLQQEVPKLDIYDAKEPSAETLLSRAKQAEDAARANPSITNSEGADASYSSGLIALATSHGFAKSYQSSSSSVSVSVIAGEGDAMETDYDYSYARLSTHLENPATVGTRAAERAVKRLNPRKIKTAQLPLIFEPRIARGLLGSFISAINGPAVARKTTFLREKMGEQLFPASVQIIDDPFEISGLGSRPFDGEGVGGKKRALVENGVLKTWLLDMRSANQLGLQTTGHAARGVSSPPSPSSTNVHLAAGKESPASLIKDIKQGLYVTDAFGMGVNLVTGDYSQGAGGIWIENGQLTYPVSEITIAGHLTEIFKNLTPANDLEMKYGTNAPTLRIDGMTIAGSN